MKLVSRSKLMNAAVVLANALVFTATIPAFAQDQRDYQQAQQPPSFSPGQIDGLVSRIALYPDPLLAQVFAAASFPDQIQDAARWADQNRNLRGDQLADAIYQSNLQFDPAVQALIPFPTVLDMMASDMNWTSELGNAVLADRAMVMDAVQRMRRSAEQYGYLRSNQQMRVVDNGPAVEIEPVDPGLIYVPTYDPYIVYAPPRPGFFVGGAIGFGSYYSIGAFGSWGWGGGFNWYNHAVLVNNNVWGRTWYNRDAYVHNYGNWDRGAWRNNYSTRNVTVNNYRNENVNRYNTYSNPGAYNRGGQYNNTYTNPSGSARGFSGQYNNGYSHSNSYSSPTYNRSQAAPMVQSQPAQSYDRGASNRYSNAYSNQGSYNRSVQAAPMVQSQPARSYDRGTSNRYSNTYSNQGSYSRSVQAAPAPQARSFGAVNGNGGGQSEHGGRRR